MTGRLKKLLTSRGLRVPGLAERPVRELSEGEAGVAVDVRVPGTCTGNINTDHWS